jgi:4-oxalocrotonate tautomerase
MPTIKVEMLEGRTEEQKRSFAKAVTEAAVKELNSEPQHVDVVFLEVSKKNWCTGGVFFSDAQG